MIAEITTLVAEITTQTRLYHGAFAFGIGCFVAWVFLVDLRFINFYGLKVEMGCDVRCPFD